jgi:hypothetical protein
MEVREWVTVARFADLNIAQVCASMLRENGIMTFLPDEALTSVLPFPAEFNLGFRSKQGAIRLQVPEEDVDRASELLRAEQSVEEDVEPADAEEEVEESTSGLRWFFQFTVISLIVVLIYVLVSSL